MIIYDQLQLNVHNAKLTAYTWKVSEDLNRYRKEMPWKKPANSNDLYNKRCWYRLLVVICVLGHSLVNSGIFFFFPFDVIVNQSGPFVLS